MEKKVIYIGLDPGKSGFITILNPTPESDENMWEFIPMPTHKVESGKLTKTGKPAMKTEFYEQGLRDIVFQIAKKYKDCQLKVGIEEVGGRQGWSAQNNFNFGLTAGMQRMIFMMLKADITMVRPQKWQSFMRQGYPNLKKKSSTGKTMVSDPKAVAELIVKTEYPHIDFRKTERSKVNDDNKVDSFLICLYLYRTLNQ
jgi:hypothetical protein